MTKKVLMIVGSIRKDSFNKTVAKYIADNLKQDGIETEFANISKLPFMDQDIEFPAPKEVTAFHDQVKETDALWIVSPEYNEMIPGVLKNALDWLSRPTEMGVFGAPKFIMNKPVILSGAGGKKAATVGLSHLLSLTKFMGLTPSENVVGLQIPTAAFMSGHFDMDDDQKQKLQMQISEVDHLFG
ncbi:hypothetical protein IV38_GL001283 [Lactobacillus selangorensis]|uniref:NADPH-dependent FMN reductase-like domain-containing protein n=1 Tax=Lactobacillus selangorensis TaxID=81857 RepID=A0A0R2FYS5_9LACO|nr:NADPH-dependent FMN reductase [Lactobacillus selangorensis]KRN29067.1 hypothetical protein IV38_GL001283 [Lactobacillus selangorensis]KRN30020.1 hypothetical protein IV40_GL002049 [Lactobacillus selangorensis]